MNRFSYILNRLPMAPLRVAAPPVGRVACRSSPRYAPRAKCCASRGHHTGDGDDDKGRNVSKNCTIWLLARCRLSGYSSRGEHNWRRSRANNCASHFHPHKHTHTHFIARALERHRRDKVTPSTPMTARGCTSLAARGRRMPECQKGTQYDRLHLYTPTRTHT